MELVEVKEVEYDEKTCITAEELRMKGLDIPIDIPDLAWIPRNALKINSATYDETEIKENYFKFKVMVEFTEPFRWFGGTFQFSL